MPNRPTRRSGPSPPVPLDATTEAEFRQELVYCHAGRPFRPLCWRFRRAEVLFALGKSARACGDDVWLQRAFRFHRDRWRLNMLAPGSRARRPALDPAIEEALDLWATTDLLRRHAVEARILANQAYDEIAGRAGLSEDAVAAYEALFYNVADCRDSPSYLMRVAIGLRIDGAYEPPEFYELWKVLALSAGVRGVEVALDVFRGPDLTPRTSGLATATQKEAEALRLLVELLLKPRKARNLVEVFKNWPRLWRQQQDRAEALSAAKTLQERLPDAQREEETPKHLGNRGPKGASKPDVGARLAV